MIDEKKSYIDCWLVWSVASSGAVTLEAIDLVHQMAVYHRSVLLESNRDLVTVRIEKSYANHTYAGDLDEKWWSLYSEEAAKRNTNTVLDICKQERNLYRDLLIRFRQAVKILMTKNDNKPLRDAMIASNLPGLTTKEDENGVC